MVDFLFYLFSALVLGSAILVVLGRNPVTAAMFLLVTIGGAAALFLLLEAFFLAVLQVLVYAGAVVVLFLFIIMLIDPETGRRRPSKLTVAGSGAAFFLLVAGVVALVTGDHALPSGTLATTAAVGNLSKDYGYYLFSIYLLPFMVAGFLLLVAMLGVILISKRYQSPEAEKI